MHHNYTYISIKYINMYSRELLKGTLKPIILKLLSDHGKMYGYEIVQMVMQHSEGKILIKEGSLYPILHSLKTEGVLETSSLEVNGRLRKYYSITKKGKSQVSVAVAELQSFVHTLQLMLTTEPSKVKLKSWNCPLPKPHNWNNT